MVGILVRFLAAALLLGSAACGNGEAGQAPRPAQASIPVGWSTLPAPPFFRFRGAAAWTGSELVYWGGESEYGDDVHGDGAAFDPATGDWRPLAAGPLSPRRGAVAVWTGNEVLVWGGDPEAVGEGAAYDPGRDEWRTLPDSPLDARVPVGAVWTGTEMIVWGSASRAASAVDGAAYDPREDRWRELPPAPFALNEATLAWTGEEMVVFGARLDGNNWSDTEHARGAAFDPATSRWRILPPYSFSPQASTAVWTGRELVVWDYELRAAAYDPADDRWRPLPDLPLDFSECYPKGAVGAGVVLAWHCGRAALLDVAADSWSEIHGAPEDIFAPPVAAGSVFLFVGAYDES
ncbi:MAG: Kelch repeat-containing protein, partial [Gaiellaceae bacterium]